MSCSMNILENIEESEKIFSSLRENRINISNLLSMFFVLFCFVHLC